MRRLPLVAALLIAPSVLGAQAPAAPAAAPAPSAADRARAERALRAAPLTDGHNDLPWAIREATPNANVEDARGAWGDSLPAALDVDAYDLRTRTKGHTDFTRLAQGMLGAQFWSVYIPGEPVDGAYGRHGKVASTPGYARVQLEQIDIARRVIARYPDRLAFATRAADVAPARRAGKIASFLGMEGGHAIENSLGALRTYYDLGVRYMTLTHNVTLDWADAALDSARHGGLTDFGRDVVREMNRLGMLVDLSHVSPGTMSDALDVAQAPVIFSHSAARGLADHPRNVPDSILARLPRNGGVVMVTFVPGFISPELVAHDRAQQAEIARLRAQAGTDTAAVRAGVTAWQASHPRPKVTLAQVADHIEHVRKVAGIDHVGIGGDFDGITETIVGLEDVSKYPALFAELARRGWTEAELRKLAGENVLRALRGAEATAARLQRGVVPRVQKAATGS
ncbi:dipeptidase [Roseisolibacter agri]|uniref:Membrane dipeptidase n=1 Tax=Roseisolibacter agri TaxID=2014610 RepID=A0AA37QEU2_9BACT|nr:dipeptidase [Roseisolibacter agri]GLC25473.1 membrane dipeptidase [Roseisolibacter agri]